MTHAIQLATETFFREKRDGRFPYFHFKEKNNYYPNDGKTTKNWNLGCKLAIEFSHQMLARFLDIFLICCQEFQKLLVHPTSFFAR